MIPTTDTSLSLPSSWMALPFLGLLGLIALAPLFFPKWWHKYYPHVTLGLAAFVLAYYGFILKNSAPIFHVAQEYFSFICLIGSLFIVSGGIHIRVKSHSKPAANIVFLLFGAILANAIGTTGASVLLIRPWLRMNHHRIGAFHVVFFIFIVSNVGGSLTPIGDPPLFIGYLKGVPFWWITTNSLAIWSVAIGYLLTVFYLLDRHNYKRIAWIDPSPTENSHGNWRVEGSLNILFLGVILASVFINNPYFVREGLMIVAALGSWLTTQKKLYERNHFSITPIKEVAILFIGIFATMLPALDLLQVHAKSLGMTSPSLLFWSSGFLSSVLDNAPTYYSFLTAMLSVFVDGEIVKQVQQLILTQGASLTAISGPQSHEILNTWAALQRYHGAKVAAGIVNVEQIKIAYLIGNPPYHLHLLALSIASVFFGATTYIGNGPNFMIKSIANEAKIATPTFLGYIYKFSIPVMLPMLLLVWFLFFRHS